MQTIAGVDAAGHEHVAAGHVTANDDAVMTALSGVTVVADMGLRKHQMALAMRSRTTIMARCV